MSKILAIDFGLKRTGLAITDDQRIFAFGLKTVASQQLMEELERLIPKEKIEHLVVGMPKRLNMEDAHISENVRMLAEALEKKFPIPVTLYDERFTSKMAAQSLHASGKSKDMRQNKGLIDEVSATLLLQSYLSWAATQSR